MLEKHEKSMAKKLLRCLPPKEVLALAQTVTNNKVDFTNEMESKQIEAIVDLSISVEELLKRRKISKDALLQHLSREGVSVSRSADKQTYVDAVISHWKTQKQAPYQRSADRVSSKPVARVSSHPVSESRLQASQPTTYTAQQNNVHQSVQHITVNNVYQQQIINNISSTPAAPAVSQHHVFAEKFVRWFYDILNESIRGNGEYGPQHFFPDCVMNVLVPARATEHVSGGEAACKRLARIVQEDGVCFCPNVTADSLEGSETAQGVKLIRACGTVRKDGKVVGVFEQNFRLIQDVGLGNNWRVKCTNIGLSTAVPVQPVTLAITGGLPTME